MSLYIDENIQITKATNLYNNTIIEIGRMTSLKEILEVGDTWHVQAGKLLSNYETEIETLRAQVEEQQAEIDRLKMALADTEALELGTAERYAIWRSRCKILEKQLAASQLSETKLREALEDWVAAYPEYSQWNDQELLATPSSTEALDAYVASVVEKVALNFSYGACSVSETLQGFTDRIRKGEF